MDIQIGFLNAEVIPELMRYETESWVRYKWDTLQREYMCCGGYGQHQVVWSMDRRLLHYFTTNLIQIS